MSSQPITAPATTGAAPTVRAGISRARAAVVALLLTLGCVASAAMVLWQPWGERNRFGYADLAPLRDAVWAGAVVDGLGIAAIGIALGLAGCLLTPARGATWATIGAVVCGLGGVAFCAGMTSFGVLAWYATAVDAIPVESGTALMTYVEANIGHVLGLQMAGFLLFTVGSLVLMAALLRSRSVPAWLPIVFGVLTVGVFTLGGVALNVVQAGQLLAPVVVAWYLVRAARTDHVS